MNGMKPAAEDVLSLPSNPQINVTRLLWDLQKKDHQLFESHLKNSYELFGPEIFKGENAIHLEIGRGHRPFSPWRWPPKILRPLFWRWKGIACGETRSPRNPKRPLSPILLDAGEMRSRRLSIRFRAGGSAPFIFFIRVPGRKITNANTAGICIPSCPT